MKKFIFFTLIATISFVSCNKNDEELPIEKFLSQKFKDQPYTYLQNKYMDSVLTYQYNKQTRSYNPENLSCDEKLEEILLLDSVINYEKQAETSADIFFYQNLEQKLMMDINSHPYIQKFVEALSLENDKEDMLIYIGDSGFGDAISKFQILKYFEDGVDVIAHYLERNNLTGDEEWTPLPIEINGPKPKGVQYTLQAKWGGNKVEYMWNGATSKDKTNTLLAMADWKTASNNKITFSEITTNVNWNKTCWIMGWKYFLRISSLSKGNFNGQATLGKVPWAIMEFTSGAWYPRTYRHELGHVLGLYHEHQRPDRDTYITYHSNNAESGSGSQFSKMTAGSYNYYGSTFDFNSIMIYGSFAYAKNQYSTDPKDATLTKKDGTIWDAPTDISNTDKNVIRQMYP